MWNNPLVGDYHLFSASDLQLTRLAAILGHTATVEWITILACLRVLEKGTWKALNAFAVLHAWGIAIQMTAGAMHHLCTDCDASEADLASATLWYTSNRRRLQRSYLP